MKLSPGRLVFFLLAATISLLAVTGCQTTKGFGKDVENLGHKIEKKAS